jgi:hypothetical protein
MAMTQYHKTSKKLIRVELEVGYQYRAVPEYQRDDEE